MSTASGNDKYNDNDVFMIMSRLEAIRVIVDHLHGDDLTVCANGAISREAFFCENRERTIYLLGSMGLPAAVGLGIALNRPRHRVVVLDGDGNLLMGFGNLALVGALKPRNFVHFVLDNRCYGTTGQQPSISADLDLSRIALAAGYRGVHDVGTPVDLAAACAAVLQQNATGPQFIRVSVSRQVPQGSPRIPYSAGEMKQRFMNAVKN